MIDWCLTSSEHFFSYIKTFEVMTSTEPLSFHQAARFGPINIYRKNWRRNQEWTIQRHWQHWAHKTQGQDNQNRKHNTEVKWILEMSRQCSIYFFHFIFNTTTTGIIIHYVDVNFHKNRLWPNEKDKQWQTKHYTEN